MHRRVWFLAAVTAAVLGLAGSATAMTAAKSSSSRCSVSVCGPVCQGVGKYPAHPRCARGQEDDGLRPRAGGHRLQPGDADENAYYAAIVAGEPIMRGNYVIDNKGNYHLDMASKVVATKKYLKIWIRKDANWYWVGHKAHPVTASDYIYTWKQIVNAAQQRRRRNTGYTNIATGEGQRQEGRDLQLADVGLHGQTPCGAFADYRDLFGLHLSGLRAQGSASGCGGGCT